MWIKFNPSIDNYLIHYKVFGEIIHPFPNFNCASVEVWERISNFIPHFTWMWDWLSTLGLKLNLQVKGPSSADIFVRNNRLDSRLSFVIFPWQLFPYIHHFPYHNITSYHIISYYIIFHQIISNHIIVYRVIVHTHVNHIIYDTVLYWGLYFQTELRNLHKRLPMFYIALEQIQGTDGTWNMSGSAMNILPPTYH